jgi:hypothetical protein
MVHRHNVLTFSRKLREQNVATSIYCCARLVGCNVLLAGMVLPPAVLTGLVWPRAEAHLTILNLQH